MRYRSKRRIDEALALILRSFLPLPTELKANQCALEIGINYYAVFGIIAMHYAIGGAESNAFAHLIIDTDQSSNVVLEFI